MTTNLTTQTPVQIDTALAELQLRAARPERQAASARKTIEAFATQGDVTGYRRVSAYDVERAEERLLEAEVELRAIDAETKPLADEFDRRGGWPRFFHVTNTGGHIHTSMHCETCFADTLFAWRTDLSGLTDEEVVAREAHNACTVCMPIAPVEQKAARERYTREQREAKAAERAAKKAEKEARKAAREESLAHKANAALDKYGDDYIKQAWYDGKITDSVYDVLYDAGRAGNEGKY